MAQILQNKNLPKGWIYVFLTDVVKNEKFAIKRGPFGGHLKKEFFVKSGYRVYEQQNAIHNDFNLGNYYIDEKKFQEMKNFEVKSGDIIISCSGTIGKIAVAPEGIKEGIINQALLKITLNVDIMPVEFFSYLFEFWMIKAQIESHGSSMGNLSSVNTLKKIPIFLPPINEQKRIISKIEELFSKIDSTKKLVEHAKLQLQVFTHSSQKKIFEELNQKYPSKKLVDVCTKINDGTHHSPPNSDNGEITYITAKNIRPGKIDLSNITYISKESHKEIFARCNPTKGDVLYTKDGTVGYAAVNELDFEFSLLSSVALLKPNHKIINPYYLVAFLNNPINYNKITKKMAGTSIRRIVLNKIKEIMIIIPPIEKQKEITTKIEQYISIIENSQNRINSTLQALETMKMSILKQAFEGKLVPQDPNDEPASVLLERIQKEKIKP